MTTDPDGMITDPGRDDRDNNLLVTGGVFALLTGVAHPESLGEIRAVTDDEGNATNQIDISLSFMKSPYRITVERVTDGDEEETT